MSGKYPVAYRQGASGFQDTKRSPETSTGGQGGDRPPRDTGTAGSGKGRRKTRFPRDAGWQDPGYDPFARAGRRGAALERAIEQFLWARDEWLRLSRILAPGVTANTPADYTLACTLCGGSGGDWNNFVSLSACGTCPPDQTVFSSNNATYAHPTITNSENVGSGIFPGSYKLRHHTLYTRNAGAPTSGPLVFPAGAALDFPMLPHWPAYVDPNDQPFEEAEPEAAATYGLIPHLPSGVWPQGRAVGNGEEPCREMFPLVRGTLRLNPVAGSTPAAKALAEAMLEIGGSLRHPFNEGEQKVWVDTKTTLAVKAVVNVASEALDIVKALYTALPKEVRMTCGGGQAVENMVNCLRLNGGAINQKDAIYNLVLNHLQDIAIGMASAARVQAAKDARSYNTTQWGLGLLCRSLADIANEKLAKALQEFDFASPEWWLEPLKGHGKDPEKVDFLKEITDHWQRNADQLEGKDPLQWLKDHYGAPSRMSGSDGFSDLGPLTSHPEWLANYYSLGGRT